MMRKIINIFISLLLIFLPLLSYASDNMDSVFVSAVVEGPVQQVGIVINEISMDSSPDWVELYNSGTEAVDIQGWTIDDVDASLPIEITESISIPAGAYLVIYIKADGTNDLDFSDGVGNYYAGLSPTVSLAVTEDEVALYNSATQDSSTIVDFVSYCSDGSYGGDANGDQVHAVDAGIWTAGTYFDFTDTGSGYSIGLTADGSDTNSTADWSFYDTPSPGTENGTAPVVIDAPVITLPSEDYDGNYTVNWNAVSEATIYQLQEDSVDTFDSVNNQEFWPNGTMENITGRLNDTYYYRIKSWTGTPQDGGTASDWSITESITVADIPSSSTRRLNCNGLTYNDGNGNTFYEDTAYSTSSGQGYVITGGAGSTADPILGTSDDVLYQTNRYGNIEYRFDLPVGMYNITLKFAETNFNSVGQRVFNVFLHDIDNANRGIKVLGDFDIFAAAGGANTAVDRTISNITVNEGFLKVTFEGITDLPLICAIEAESTPYVIGDIGMTDEDFLDMVERKAFNWFYDNVQPPYYLSGAWGPYDNNAFMFDTNIAGIGFQLIVYCIGIDRGWMTYEEGYNRIKGIFEGIKLMKKGPIGDDSNPYETYWHYYERMNPSNPIPDQDPVRSIFDNGDLMMGVVFAEEYFKGTEIELMARQVYESLDWNKFGDYTNPTYSEEMIAVLLGASAPRESCRNDTMIAGFNNANDAVLNTPLYFYQWLNIFYDGRNTTTPNGRNDFEYAMNSTLVNRQEHIDLWLGDPVEYNTYDWDTWGLTAASRDGDYGFAGHYGGDVNPFAVAASLPFAPTECLNAMKHMYYRFYKNGFRTYIGPIWSDMYGFCQTYNIGSTSNESSYYISPGNGAFDYGSIVMGIENYRTGFVWQYTMNSEYIKAGMYRIGMSGYTTPPAINIAEGKPVTASDQVGGNDAAKAVDDDLITRWEANSASGVDWLWIDLQDNYDIDKIEIFWEGAYAVSYQIQTSFDAASWTDVYSTTSSDGAVDRISFSPAATGRYVRVYCTEKALPSFGYSIWGIKVYGTQAASLSAPVINGMPSPDTDGDYQVDWNDVTEATIYQLQESSDPTFATGTAEFWPSSSFMDVYGKTDGTYYYRVRAWTAAPENSGTESSWSASESVTVNK